MSAEQERLFEDALAKFRAGAEGVITTPYTIPLYLTPEQVRRLIAHLHRLSGHAPAPLPAGELEAIRARDDEAQRRARLPAHQGFLPLTFGCEDRHALLAHVTALTADLAAAGGEVEGLNHVVACMKNDRLAYQMGVEDERRRIVEWLRAEASRAMSAGAVVTAGALRAEAHLIESPPAPAAAKEGE